MEQAVCKKCGGCALRGLSEADYRQEKQTKFKAVIARVKGGMPVFDTPVFISDGLRRRADMAFEYVKGKLTLGFNEAESHNLIDVETCLMLCPELNAVLPEIRRFLTEFCRLHITIKNKRKKIEKVSISSGSIQLLCADNGIDILLNVPIEPGVEHRLLIAEVVNASPEIIRMSWKVGAFAPETIVEKLTPQLYIATYHIDVPQGVFLQASKQAEMRMIEIVLSYMGETRGKIADLFCGLGTFTYPLAQNKENEIISVDSNGDSLKGLQKALNRNQLQNVSVLNRNLFKYPLDATELRDVKALVIDPPRAGAHAQCREISTLTFAQKPEKIVFVSCNPETFVCDAEILIQSGYKFERVTLIDQFVYSKHQELVALFILNPQK